MSSNNCLISISKASANLPIVSRVGVLSILVCVCIAVGVTSCTTESKKSDSDKNKKMSYNVNEPAVFEDVEYTVTNVEYSNGSEYDVPADGKNYVIVTLTIKNNSDSKISYNSLDWKMLNSNGQEDTESFSTINNDSSLNSGDLATGGTKTGTLVFEEPTDETSLKLLYYSNALFDENSSFEIVIK